jgi:hypothetical protein
VRHRWLLVALKALGGAVAGFALWWTLAGPYNELLAGLADPFVVPHLHAWNGNIVIDLAALPAGSPRPAVSAGNLTANVILLAALFATNRNALSLRNAAEFAFAALILMAIHIVATVANVESILAWDLGGWSSAHYGRFERRFWEGLTNFYTVAGAFGAAFLLWWLSCTLSGNAPLSDDPPQRRRSARQR